MFVKRNARAKKLENMRKAKERIRLNSSRPDYPFELPALRREVIIRDYDSGVVEYRFYLFKTKRIDVYKAETEGKVIGNMGWSKILEIIRKGFLRRRQC